MKQSPVFSPIQTGQKRNLRQILQEVYNYLSPFSASSSFSAVLKPLMLAAIPCLILQAAVLYGLLIYSGNNQIIIASLTGDYSSLQLTSCILPLIGVLLVGLLAHYIYILPYCIVFNFQKELLAPKKLMQRTAQLYLRTLPGCIGYSLLYILSLILIVGIYAAIPITIGYTLYIMRKAAESNSSPQKAQGISWFACLKDGFRSGTIYWARSFALLFLLLLLWTVTVAIFFLPENLFNAAYMQMLISEHEIGISPELPSYFHPLGIILYLLTEIAMSIMIWFSGIAIAAHSDSLCVRMEERSQLQQTSQAVSPEE